MTISSALAAPEHTASLLSMLRHAVVDCDDKPVGRLDDVVALLRADNPPIIMGLVVAASARHVFVPVADVIDINADVIRLRTSGTSAEPFARRDGEVLLKQDVLGHRLVDLRRGVLVRAYDVRLKAQAEGWIAIGFDVHKHSWFHFGAHEGHPTKEWRDFMLLIRGPQSAGASTSATPIQQLKPAQIADIIEGASAEEQDLLLAQVHADPELEADVFEELDEDRQAQLLKSRADRDIADVLSRMRADDVADAVMKLPQPRRQPVLDLLPAPQQAKVMALLGYNPATAGGLMGTDFLALSEDRTIHDALQELRIATTQQLEALTTIHSLDPDGRLAGTLGLVRALQLDPATLLRDAADPRTVVASPEDDIVAVTTRMADYNLLSLPVLDAEGRILGIVTVDDALEAAIPRDWTRRGGGDPIPH